MKTENIISFALGFVSSLSINMFTHIFTKIRDEKNTFLKLSDELKKPFIEAKLILDITTRGLAESCVASGIFISLYSGQRINIQKISSHIPRRQVKHLQAAWSKYEKQINNESPSSWFDHDNIYKSEGEIIEKRKNLVEQIDNILFFFDYQNVFSVLRILKRFNYKPQAQQENQPDRRAGKRGVVD